MACPYEQGFNKSVDTQEADCVFNIEDVELMQFAGLKDKNKTNVYERDLVVIYSADSQKSLPYVIEFINGSFLMCNKQHHQYFPIAGVPMEEYEVIGNIYENPELLK